MSLSLPSTPPIETTFFDLPNLRLHAAVAGPADGPLVILLHGFPEFWYGWRRQIGPLAEAGFRVVVPDQRGYNLSHKFGPYDTTTLVNDVVQLIDAQGRERAYVAGHDWGAAVAWRLAERHPERLARLAILNVPRPQLLYRKLAGLNLKQLSKSWYAFFFQIPGLPEWALRRDDYRAMRESMLRSSRPGSFTPNDLDRYVQAWRQPGALEAMLGWYRAEFRRAIRARGREAAPPISTPTLIIWGERDIALEVALAEESRQTLEHGKLVRFPEATHWVQHDFPEQVTQLLRDHFSKG